MLKKLILNKFSTSELEMELIQRKNYNTSPSYKKDYSTMLYSLHRDLEKSIIQNDAYERFRGVIHNVEKACHSFPEDALDLMKSFRKMISLELSYSYIPQIVYNGNGNDFYLSMPITYMDNGEVEFLKREKVVINQEDKVLVSSPYDINKWLNAIKREEDFDMKLSDPGIPLFFPELNLLLQDSGTVHRSCDIFLNRQNQQLKVWQYDDSPLYEHISTDGVNWFNVNDNEELVYDYRLALLFEIRRREKELE